MTSEPAAGRTVYGYTLQERIGSGGFSTVWRARSNETERTVALKLASFETHRREQVLRQFDQERRMLEPLCRGLSSGRVVQYLDGEVDDESAYIALEYLPDEPLVDTFGTEMLGSGVRRRIALDLAETLDFLHRNGVVYLDLKAENVIIRRSGRPVLIDFNAAISRDESVRTTFETDQFKAPELIRGGGIDHPAGPWSDVFSWGKLAFYLLTGAKVPTENVPDDGLDPRSFGSSCSESLARIVNRATTPSPDSRYEDGLALATAVSDATRGPRMVLTHGETGVSCAVGDGDTMGRDDPEAPTPTVVLSDPGGHISPQHVRFERSGDSLELLDRSINGTYVGTKSGWTHVLSENGYHAQCEQGRLTAGQDQPPSRLPIPDRAMLAPVHPTYGVKVGVKNQ